jgi:stage II sporulation protein R
MKFKIWELALIVAVAVTIIIGSSVNRDANELSSKLIRLHVVANSDSGEDQALKLKVRDAVLEELCDSLKNVDSRKEAESIISDNADALLSCAKRTVQDNGYDYDITLSLCTEQFPTTEYDTFSLPAGEYESLRITIGEGSGHNWWCVVYPPVCTAATIEDAAKTVGLTDAEFSLITESSEGFIVKFKLMELLAKLKAVMA